MSFDRKAYQREYARKKYQSLSPEERKIKYSSSSAKQAKIKYRSKPENKEKENAYTRQWYRQNKERKQRVSRLWRYGLSETQYNNLLEKQNKLCPICNKPPIKKARLSSPDGFAIDHCHNTNKVRGLLCESCNKLIGYAKDSVQVLQNAISYLQEFSNANV